MFNVRIIGRLTRRSSKLPVRKLPRLRLHTRTIIRDGHRAFIGSQSLRPVELDGRRELGIVLYDAKVVSRLIRIFEHDWTSAGAQAEAAAKDSEGTPVEKAARKIAKAVARDLPPVTPVLEEAVKEVVGGNAKVELDADEIEAAVKDAVKEAVKDAVKDVVEEAVDQDDADEPRQ